MPRIKKEQEETAPLKKFRKVFVALDKPSDKAPTMPTAITRLSAEKLGDIQSHYTAWREYTEDILQDALVDFLSQKETFDYKWGQEYLLISGKNNEERTAKIMQNEDIKKLSISLSNAEMYHTLLQKKLESFTNCLTVISREISRRSGLEYHKS